MRAWIAGRLRRWSDLLDRPVHAPGLEDPLQVALRVVIAATREDDRAASMSAAVSVLRRVDTSVLAGALLHLAVLMAHPAAGASRREGVRDWAQYVLAAEQFRELVEAGVLGEDLS